MVVIEDFQKDCLPQYIQTHLIRSTNTNWLPVPNLPVPCLHILLDFFALPALVFQQGSAPHENVHVRCQVQHAVLSHS